MNTGDVYYIVKYFDFEEWVEKETKCCEICFIFLDSYSKLRADFEKKVF